MVKSKNTQCKKENLILWLSLSVGYTFIMFGLILSVI
jgi:hypothetical protein